MQLVIQGLRLWILRGIPQRLSLWVWVLVWGRRFGEGEFHVCQVVVGEYRIVNGEVDASYENRMKVLKVRKRA